MRRVLGLLVLLLVALVPAVYSQTSTVGPFDEYIAVSAGQSCTFEATGTNEREGSTSVGVTLNLVGVDSVYEFDYDSYYVEVTAAIEHTFTADGTAHVTYQATGYGTNLEVEFDYNCSAPPPPPPVTPIPPPPICTAGGGCHVTGFDGVGIAAWTHSSGNFAWTPAPTWAVISSTGWMGQDVCLGVGDYVIEVVARGMTDTTPAFAPFWVPEEPGVSTVIMRTTLDEYSGGVEGVPIITMTQPAQSFLFNINVSGVTNWHRLKIEHIGSRDALVIQSVCVHDVLEPPRDPSVCGYVRNALFAETGVLRADPWRIDYGRPPHLPRFAANEVEIPFNAGIAQTINVTESGTITYSFGAQAGVAMFQPATLRLRAKFADGSSYTTDWDLLSAEWQLITTTFASDSRVVELKLDSIGSYALGILGNTAVVRWVCLADGELPPPEERPVYSETRCLLCQQPLPYGCDTTLASGDCDYYGNHFADGGFGEAITNLIEVIIRLFRWLKCWLVCLIDNISLENGDAFGPFPSLDDIRCWIMEIPRLIENATATLVDRAANWIADFDIGRWWADRQTDLANWWHAVVYDILEQDNPYAAMRSAAWSALLALGDLYVQVINTVLLPFLLLIWVFARTYELILIFLEALKAPADTITIDSEVWYYTICVMDNIKWIMDNSALSLLPGAATAIMLLEAIKWTVRKLQEVS